MSSRLAKHKDNPFQGATGPRNEGALSVEMGVTASMLDSLIEEVAMLSDRLRPVLPAKGDAVEVRPEKPEEILSPLALSARTTNDQLRILIESISYLKRNIQI